MHVHVHNSELRRTAKKHWGASEESVESFERTRDFFKGVHLQRTVTVPYVKDFLANIYVNNSSREDESQK